MNKLAGLGKTDRTRLALILRGTKGTVSVGEAADLLGVPASVAAKLMSRWAQAGWLSRVHRGLYIPVSLESRTADIPLEDPWIVAARLYEPCYIGGWSAAEYWDLTEQIFRTVLVMTTRKPRQRKTKIKGTDFLLRTVSDKALFGLKSVWRGQVKVNLSDPARTIIDMLGEPRLGGGIRSVTDMFVAYLKSEKIDLDLLANYAEQLGNGAVYKRMGFLLEKLGYEDETIIKRCQGKLTTGYAKLDTSLPAEKLVTRWRLWVPERWLKEIPVDK